MKWASRRSTIWLVALALVVGACTSAGSTPASQATQSGPGPTSAAPQLPPAPTNFSASRHQGSVPCPSPSGGGASRSQTDLAWQSSADPATWFKVYEASTGEGPETCSDVQSQAQVTLETKPAVRSSQLFAEMAVGGGETCLWIVAVNSAGESAQVPAAGQ
jgi:hypothetical protein